MRKSGSCPDCALDDSCGESRDSFACKWVRAHHDKSKTRKGGIMAIVKLALLVVVFGLMCGECGVDYYLPYLVAVAMGVMAYKRGE